MSLVERCKGIFQTLRGGPARLPSRAWIPAGNVDRPERLGPPFEKDRHYFQVRVNQLHLANGRQWFATYDPMVFVASEFIYDRGEEAIPFVVGPSMLEKTGQELPTGMVFSDTRVAGVHPYRGGRLNLTVILYQVQRDNLARGLLRVVESTAGALDFSTAVAAYTKVAGAVLDGVETLVGLGTTVPLMGYRQEIDPDGGDVLEPGYFALIAANGIDPATLWVKDSRLFQGPTAREAKPLATDHVLLSLASTTRRSDEAILPFYPLWERVEREASVPTPASWKSAKANLLSLYQTMMLSPDLTESHAEELVDGYAGTAKERYERAVRLGKLEKKEEDGMAGIRKRSLGLLDL